MREAAVEGKLEFLREGSREIRRKISRKAMRRRLAAEDRQRDEALAHLGGSAWIAQVDLSGLPEIRSQLEELQQRSTGLAATLQQLESDRAALQERRAGCLARFEALRTPAQAGKRDADTALGAARHRLGTLERAVRAIEGRLAQIDAILAEPEPATPVRSGAAREQLHAEKGALATQLIAESASREQAAADVGRLNIQSQGWAGELTRIDDDHRAALSPIEADLARIDQELRGITQEKAAVGRLQSERFRDLGAALCARNVSHPELAESVHAVAAAERSRGAAQAELMDSLSLTRAMPRGTMAKFWTFTIVVPLLLIGGLQFVLFPGSAKRDPEHYEPARSERPTERPRIRAAVRAEESRKDVVVEAFVRSPGEETRRRDAVEILQEDLLTVGSTANRAYLEPLAKILRRGEPELRAAAAQSIAMIGPTAAEARVLADALNDPVPAVRNSALMALEQIRDDLSSELLVLRVRSRAGTRSRGDRERFQPDIPPDQRRLGLPIYPGAQPLQFATDLLAGWAGFTSEDTPQRIVEFYASIAGHRSMNGEEFTRAYFGGSPSDPTGMNRLAAETEAWFRQAAQSGRSVSEIEAEAERRSALGTDLPMVRYADARLYGHPVFVALEEPPSRGIATAARYVVVFRDNAFGRTGFDVRFPPDLKAR
jgi:hypothetical protein